MGIFFDFFLFFSFLFYLYLFKLGKLTLAMGNGANCPEPEWVTLSFIQLYPPLV